MDKLHGSNTFWDALKLEFIDKCIITQDRSIAEIKEALKYPGDKQSLINFICRRRKLIKDRPSTSTPANANAGKDNIPVADRVEEIHQFSEVQVLQKELQTNKIEYKNLREKYAVLLKESLLQDRLLDYFKNKVDSLPPVKVDHSYFKLKTEGKKDIKDNTEHCVLVLSDWHIGEVVSKNETGGFGEYNFDIFVRRLQYVADAIKKLVTVKLSNYNLEKLWIAGLGDFVSGIIHEELIETSDTNIIDWSLGGALILAQFIKEMTFLFKEIEFIGVVGNHGRMKKKPSFKRRYVNWDYILYSMTSVLLNKITNVKFDLPKSFFTLRNINGKDFLLLHGDNIKAWNGIPWYGINRMSHRLSELFASRNQSFQYILLAHFHNLSTLDRVVGEKIINGSGMGGNEFSLGQMFTSNEPKQLFFGVHHVKGMSFRYPINLAYTPAKDKLRYSYDPNINLGDQI